MKITAITDVSTNYIHCPKCKVPMTRVLDIKMKDQGFFSNPLVTQHNAQCPKCYRVWEIHFSTPSPGKKP